MRSSQVHCRWPPPQNLSPGNARKRMHDNLGGDHGADQEGLHACRNKALAAKLEAERKLKEGISGHRTGLPKKLLELFAPLPLPGVLPELKRRPPKVPYSGIGQYVAGFAEKGDPEYEPEPAVPEGGHKPKPDSPRIFKNPELVVQARFDYETRAEKCAPFTGSVSQPSAPDVFFSHMHSDAMECTKHEHLQGCIYLSLTPALTWQSFLYILTLHRMLQEDTHCKGADL